jgi:hypothetical protein
MPSDLNGFHASRKAYEVGLIQDGDVTIRSVARQNRTPTHSRVCLSNTTTHAAQQTSKCGTDTGSKGCRFYLGSRKNQYTPFG